MEERPWAEWRKGKPITPPQLASLLKPFGIEPRTIRFGEGGKSSAKGYLREQFEDAFARYLPASSPAVTASQPPTNGCDEQMLSPHIRSAPMRHDVTDSSVRDGVTDAANPCVTTGKVGIAAELRDGDDVTAQDAELGSVHYEGEDADDSPPF